MHRPQRPVFEVPYVVAIVELEEGWMMLTNLIGVKTEPIELGMPGRGQPLLDDLLELDRGHTGMRGHHQLEQAVLAGGGDGLLHLKLFGRRWE